MMNPDAYAPDGLICPHCQSSEHHEIETRSYDGIVVRTHQCGRGCRFESRQVVATAREFESWWTRRRRSR